MDFASAYILVEEEEEDLEIQESVGDCIEAGDDCIEFGDDCMELEDDCLESEIMGFEIEDIPRVPRVKAAEQKSKGTSLNTVNLKLQVLKDEAPELILKEKLKYRCANVRVCGAVLSQIDVPIDIPGSSDKMWECRFCGVQRTIKKWPEFKNCPNGDILFLNDPEILPDLDLGPKENTVVFVLDCSGSMSTPVDLQEDKHGVVVVSAKSKNNRGTRTSSGMGIPLPAGNTRLEALKDGVVEEIRKLVKDSPNTKVGLLSFHNTVTVTGDGSQTPVEVKGLDLHDYTLLLNIGQKVKPLSAVSESYPKLLHALNELTEGGMTALGPSLVIAMAMASKSQTSKVILCTDGFANVGVGNIHGGVSKEAQMFYTDVAAHCKTNGVSVSLISFDECGYAKALGELPVETGGLLWRVDPDETDLKINDALTRRTMAVDASVRFVVNKQLYVDNADDEKEERSNFTHLLGNIHTDMSHTFKFGFRCPDEKARKDKEDAFQDVPGEKPRQIKDKPKPKDNPQQNKDNPGEKKDNPDEKKDNPDEKKDNPDEKKENPDEKDNSDVQKDNPDVKKVKLTPSENVQSTSDKTQDDKDVQKADQMPDLNKKFTPFQQVQIYSEDLNDILLRTRKENPDEKKENPDEKKENPDEKKENPDEKKENPEERQLVPVGNVRPDITQDEKDNALAVNEYREYVPFQVQIDFVDLNGTEATRIWSTLMPITGKKEEAEDASNATTLIENMIQTASKRLLEIFNGKIKNISLQMEAAKYKEEAIKLLKHQNITDEEIILLNKFSKLLTKIARTSDIDDRIAQKLRNFQASGVNMGPTQSSN